MPKATTSCEFWKPTDTDNLNAKSNENAAIPVGASNLTVQLSEIFQTLIETAPLGFPKRTLLANSRDKRASPADATTMLTIQTDRHVITSCASILESVGGREA